MATMKCKYFSHHRPLVDLSRLIHYIPNMNDVINLNILFSVLFCCHLIVSICVSAAATISVDKHYQYFLYDRPWISPWIKLISNILHACITNAKLIVTSWPALHDQLRHHYQNVKTLSEAWCGGVKIVFLIIIYGLIKSFKCSRFQLSLVTQIGWIHLFVVKSALQHTNTHCKHRKHAI